MLTGWRFQSTTVTAIFVAKVEMKVNVYWMRIPVDNGNCHLFVASKTRNGDKSESENLQGKDEEDESTYLKGHFKKSQQIIFNISKS